MKPVLKLLSTTALIIALAGCAAQKSAVKTAESEMLYNQALKALCEHRFIIKTEEFYFPNGEAPRSSPDSYISMRDNWAVARYSPVVFPDFVSFGPLNREDTAEITKEKSRKNGDVEFCLKIGTNHLFGPKQRIIITLYGNTNKCFVVVNDGKKFSGYIYPLNN